MTATLTSLVQAEADLVATLDAATSLIGRLATGKLDAALERLQHAADNARQRLQGGLAKMRATIAFLTADIGQATADLLEDLRGELPLPSTSSPDGLPEPSTNGHVPAPVVEPPAPRKHFGLPLVDELLDVVAESNGHHAESTGIPIDSDTPTSTPSSPATATPTETAHQPADLFTPACEPAFSTDGANVEETVTVAANAPASVEDTPAITSTTLPAVEVPVPTGKGRKPRRKGKAGT